MKTKEQNARHQAAWRDRQRLIKEKAAEKEQQAAVIAELLALAVKDVSIQRMAGGVHVEVDYDAALYAELDAKCRDAGVDTDGMIQLHIKWATKNYIEDCQRVTASG